jgi:hypothetical protein
VSIKDRIREATQTIAAMNQFLTDVREEYKAATTEHGQFHSAHEGYAVLLEEVDELKEWVWKKRKNRDGAAMYGECVQIAAMAMKFAIGVALPAKEKKT